MSSRREAFGRWLLVGLVALGLALSGRAHHAVCHAHGADGHAHACCPVEEAATGEDVAEVHEGEHTCPLCFLGLDLPPEPLVLIDTPLGVARVEVARLVTTPRAAAPLTESERGPPQAVQA